jgi:hypothetical protein
VGGSRGMRGGNGESSADKREGEDEVEESHSSCFAGSSEAGPISLELKSCCWKRRSERSSAPLIDVQASGGR